MSEVVIIPEIQAPNHVTLEYDVEVPFVTLVTQADWAEDDPTKKAFIKNKPDLKPVATSGDYDDLDNKPTIPVVPTNVSSFTNDAGYITKNVDDLTNYTKTSNLAEVATSGDYNDLINTPTIPVQLQSDWNQNNTSAKDYIKNKPTVLSAFVNDAGFIDNTVNNLVNYPLSSSLATVATSGSYNDLSDTPSIPTSNDYISQTSHTTKLIGSTATINYVNYPTLESTNSYGNFAVGNSYRYVLFKEYDATLHSNGTAYVEGGGAACLHYLNNLRIDLLSRTGGAEFLLRKDTNSTPILAFSTNDNASMNLPKGISILTQTSGSTMDFISSGKIQIVNISTGGIEIIKSAQSIKLQDSGVLAITNSSGQTDIVGTGGVNINGASNAVNIAGGGGIAVSGPTFTFNTKNVATLNDIPSLTGYATETYVTNAVSTHNSSNLAHSDIRALIPAQATSTNQLADKAFVNSSIATETATFQGNYNVVSDLSLNYNASRSDIILALYNLSLTPDENDYLFVNVPTSNLTPTEIAYVDKYKYDGTTWSYEYTLNNSGYTAVQWASINSGITSNLVTQIGTNTSDILTLQGTVAGHTTDIAGKVSKSGDTMTGDLTMDSSGIWLTAVNSTTYKYYISVESNVISIKRTNLDGSNPATRLSIGGSTSTFRGNVYGNGNNIEYNRFLTHSEIDNPTTSTTVTLVGGITHLNELGSIDYATIALPATLGTAEYNGTFTSTTSGDLTVSLPLTYWQGDTDIVAGKTYSFSIQNGVGFIIQLD